MTADAFDRFTSWCRAIQFHQIDKLFSVHPVCDQCPVCSDAVEVHSDSNFLVHLHILEPTDKLHVHGVGIDEQAAKVAACAAAIALLENLEPEIFSLRRKRLRVRLEDFGVTVPKTGHMMLLADGRDEGLSGLPKPLIDLVTAIVPPEEENDDEEDASPKTRSAPDMQTITLESQRLLSAVPHMSADEIEQSFSKIGLSLCDEMNMGMNAYLFAAIVAIALRLDLDVLSTDEKLKLAFSKVTEQVIVFNAEKFSGFEKVVARLLRFYAANRALPFMAKNRLECLAVNLSAGGFALLSSAQPPLNEEKLTAIVMSKTPEKSYLDSLFFEFSKINVVIKDLFGVDGSIYGSLVNGFPTSSSDIDVVVNLSQVATPAPHVPADDSDDDSQPKSSTDLENLNKLHDAVKLKFGEEFSVSKIETARVPILIIKKGDVEINLSFNHEVVIHNSALLRAYSSLHPKVRELVVLVKHWAKLRDVNDALQGTLSSYSFVLLVISFLQAKGFLPDLQNPPERLVARPLPERLSDNGRCSTWFYENFDASTFGATTSKLDKTPLTDLLCDFFRYFLFEINYVTDVVTVCERVTGWGGVTVGAPPGRRTILKRELLRHKDDPAQLDVVGLRKRTWFTIADPFEPGRLLGTSARGAELLVKEMRRGVDLLLDGDVDELFTKYSRRDGFRFSVIPLRNLSRKDWLVEYFPRQSLKKETQITNRQVLEVMLQLTQDARGCSDVTTFKCFCFLNNIGVPRHEQLVTLGLVGPGGQLDVTNTAVLKQLIANHQPQGVSQVSSQQASHGGQGWQEKGAGQGHQASHGGNHSGKGYGQGYQAAKGYGRGQWNSQPANGKGHHHDATVDWRGPHMKGHQGKGNDGKGQHSKANDGKGNHGKGKGASHVHQRAPEILPDGQLVDKKPKAPKKKPSPTVSPSGGMAGRQIGTNA